MHKNNNIIIEINRNGILEKAYIGSVIAIDKNRNKILDFNYSNKQNIIFRSMQKPFQTYSFLLSGAYEQFNLNEKHLAIISGSHAGTLSQANLIKEILSKAKLKISELKCPKTYPLDISTKNLLIKRNQKISAIYNNCSGKHVGMLCACKSYNYPTENYISLNHPLQRKISMQTLNLCEFNEEITAIDGCGVPVLALPLKNMAIGLQNFYQTKEGKKIISAIIKYPMIYGGKNRFDTEIIKLTKGKIFAKVGAAGLIGMLNLETLETLIIKIFTDDHSARAEVSINFMKKLNWIN